jgi:hypothetical protein
MYYIYLLYSCEHLVLNLLAVTCSIVLAKKKIQKKTSFARSTLQRAAMRMSATAVCPSRAATYSGVPPPYI